MRQEHMPHASQEKESTLSPLEQEMEQLYENSSIVRLDGKTEVEQIRNQPLDTREAHRRIEALKKTYQERLGHVYKGLGERGKILMQKAMKEIFY